MADHKGTTASLCNYPCSSQESQHMSVAGIHFHQSSMVSVVDCADTLEQSAFIPAPQFQCGTRMVPRWRKALRRYVT